MAGIWIGQNRPSGGTDVAGCCLNTLESPAEEKTLDSSAEEKTLESSANSKRGVTVDPLKMEQDKDSKVDQLVPGASPDVDPKAKCESGSEGKKSEEVSSLETETSAAGGSRSQKSQSQKERGSGQPTAPPRLKTNLKLTTDRVSQGQETSSPAVPESPWGKDFCPLTPGAMDLQSPVIIIGDEVFQVIDDCPPPPAPFPHRIVTLRQGDVASLYDLNMNEILGGGRYGEVHLCREKSSGLQLVAKVLKIQSSREREMAVNEIAVMNQLDHRNLIQMFDALETPTEIFLFLEYVEGGELFERIIDENYQLTEVDAMVYVRQICEGIFYLHQMYVLHLDLKPDNIVCVSPNSHMVKIIDFGLARRYKPQKKLKVSFGTAEFLAPEVVNFDFVSFPTDMWSVGVITYMMVSGLSPFLGDNETETLNNVLSGDIDFDEEPFELVSDEGKEFISNLMIREKSGRMSAAQCLKHPWLNDLARKAKLCHRLLKSQIELRKYMMRRRWKKNVFAVTAANRFLKISSSSCLTSLGE